MEVCFSSSIDDKENKENQIPSESYELKSFIKEIKRTIFEEGNTTEEKSGLTQPSFSTLAMLSKLQHSAKIVLFLTKL